jgi:sarcosine oxidase subunit gamma
MRQSALSHRHLYAHGDTEAMEVAKAAATVHLAEQPHRGKLNLRGDPDDKDFLAAAGRALGLVLPTSPNTVSGGDGDGCAALWLGPDEWLVTCAPGDEAGLRDKLAAALADRHHSLVDVTDSLTTIRVDGPRAADLLAKGFPLDLHPRAFPPGSVGQSTLAKADALVHCLAQNADSGPVFEVTVRRSFAEYLWLWLQDHGREYGLPPLD